MNIPMLCRVCGHDLDTHRGACGHRECSCLCWIPPEVPEAELPEPYQEAAMMAVLDAIMAEKESVIMIDTRDGRVCRIKVTYVPGVGSEVSVNSTGGRA